jgi:HTH-type transcriptional regulator/antitoxin HigA
MPRAAKGVNSQYRFGILSAVIDTNTPINIDTKEYAKLLVSILPEPIVSEKQYKDVLSVSSRLITKGSKRSPEETTLLRLLTVLISDYEARCPIELTSESLSPPEILKYLMEENGMTQTDFASIPQSRISEILAGKRKISKAQAQVFADRFRVNPSLFLHL